MVGLCCNNVLLIIELQPPRDLQCSYCVPKHIASAPSCIILKLH